MIQSIANFKFQRFGQLVLFSLVVFSCAKKGSEDTIFGEYVDQGSGISMIVLKSDSTYQEFQGKHEINNSEFSDPEIKIAYPANPKCSGLFILRLEGSEMVLTLNPQNAGYPCYESKFLWEEDGFRQKSGVTPGSWITFTRKERK